MIVGSPGPHSKSPSSSVLLDATFENDTNVPLSPACPDGQLGLRTSGTWYGGTNGTRNRGTGPNSPPFVGVTTSVPAPLSLLTYCSSGRSGQFEKANRGRCLRQTPVTLSSRSRCDVVPTIGSPIRRLRSSGGRERELCLGRQRLSRRGSLATSAMMPLLMPCAS